MHETELFFDKDVNNYFWFLVKEAETKPDFFEVDSEVWDKIQQLGYTGKNDIREIMEYLEYNYQITHSFGTYRGTMITGEPKHLLEALIIINGQMLSNFISITVYNIDERSRYILQKETLKSMLYFFDIDKEGNVIGPDTMTFNKNVSKPIKDLWI